MRQHMLHTNNTIDLRGRKVIMQHHNSKKQKKLYAFLERLFLQLDCYRNILRFTFPNSLFSNVDRL